MDEGRHNYRAMVLMEGGELFQVQFTTLGMAGTQAADSWEVDNKSMAVPRPRPHTGDWQPCHQSLLYLEMCNNV